MKKHWETDSTESEWRSHHERRSKESNYNRQCTGINRNYCVSGTVHSSEKVERREREKYYREIEAEYVKEVRVFLNEEGYSNSGVTMTKVIDEEENRSYTMTIHHRGIGNLQQEEQEQLQEELLQIRREKMEGVITYIFL